MPYLKGVYVTLKQSQQAFFYKLLASLVIKLKLLPPALYKKDKEPDDLMGDGSFLAGFRLLL